MMMDDDYRRATLPRSRQTDVLPRHLVSFYSDLVGVGFECVQLLSALEQRDGTDVMVAARDMELLWATATGALGAAERDELDAVFREQALVALDACRARAADALALALRVTAGWSGTKFQLVAALRRSCAAMGLQVPVEIDRLRGTPPSYS